MELKIGDIVGVLNLSWTTKPPVLEPYRVLKVTAQKVQTESIPRPERAAKGAESSPRRFDKGDIVVVFPDEATAFARLRRAYDDHANRSGQIKEAERRREGAALKIMRGEV